MTETTPDRADATDSAAADLAADVGLSGVSSEPRQASTSDDEPADEPALAVDAPEFGVAGQAERVTDVASESGGGSARLKKLEAEGDIAADYLEELLDIADLDGDLDMDVEGDRAAVSIVGDDLDGLIGEDGEVLEALQELTRLAVYRETGERSRLMLDIGGYRADLKKNLVELAQDAIEDVRATGEAVKLAPMSPFERKVVHDAVAAAGLRSESEGDEPTRCVVVHPA
jgi:spoIIIJ-associated protein